ncbi:hypothetical protein LXL04_001875 [Taraxacum kok-saghyz]
MIYLLFTVLFAEMIIILLLLLKTPLREPLIDVFDASKQGKAQLVVKSIGATVFIVMMYNIYTVLEIRSCSVDSPNRVILVNRILEASLMGISLFLLLIMDSLHQHIKQVVMLKQTIMAINKQNQAFEDINIKNSHLAKSIKQDLSKLTTAMKKLESECDKKERDVQSRKANSSALKSQLEGLHVDYDYLLTENKDLKDQLRDINQKLSHSNSNTKNTSFFSWDQWGL